MFKFIKRPSLLRGAVVALLVTGAAAQASTVTVGSFTFDANAWADDAQIAVTISGAGGPATWPGSAADGDLTTAANLNGSFVEIFFDDNVLINGAGADLVVFTGTNNNAINLWGAAGQGPRIGGALSPIFSSDPGNPNGFTILAQAFDLSDLGFADGAEVTSGLFLRRGGIFGTVWDVAALNSRDAGIVDPGPGPNPIPLPAGLPLLLGALGAFAWMRRPARKTA